ncbi:hypothetical protein [Nocardia sp. NPDC051463]|uniref:hypothetical protein n=1 Tax=Nocardia sp. NPDC051463 TaxID=3154845 RepID=UPI00344DB474
MESDPDSHAYWSEEHKLWLPKGRTELPGPTAPHVEPEPNRSSLRIPIARLVALVITAALVGLILVLLHDVIPGALVELIALVPVLFFDLTARTIERRKFAWPTTFRSIVGTRPWYVSAVGYAALLVAMADLTGALLQAVGGTVALLGLLNIVIGVAMGVFIGWRVGLHGRPLSTIVETAFLAGLLGGLFDLVLVGRERFSEVHAGATLVAVVIVNGIVFTATGFVGYLGLTTWRRLRPPRLLLSPDRLHVWDGIAWQRVEPDRRSYRSGGKRVVFTPQATSSRHGPSHP